MQTVQNGIWSGIFATSAMTIGFLKSFKMLPEKEKSPLPPATLTTQILRRVGLDQKLTSEGRQNAALISHFGYGISCSLLYALLPANFKKAPVLAGLGFGTAVWGLSYLGLIPSLGLRARASNMPANRNALMIATHLIWGGVLGYTESELRQSGHRVFDGHRKAPAAE